jgi:hypothetical protein
MKIKIRKTIKIKINQKLRRMMSKKNNKIKLISKIEKTIKNEFQLRKILLKYI